MSNTPYQANHCLSVFAKMMSLSEVWGVRDPHTNPCLKIQRFPEHRRERFLSGSEIAALGKALAIAEETGTESPVVTAAFRLLLLTGCRLSEIQTLKWEYVRLDPGEFHLPDSKSGAKIVYLGAAALEILRTMPRDEDNPFVIQGKLPFSHITDLQHPWRRIRTAAGLPGVRIHDLRHTFASGGVAAGENLPMIGKLLGHTQVQTTARYAHLASAPVKLAADKIAGRIAESLAS